MSKLVVVKDADSKSSCCSASDATPAQDIREVVKQHYGQAVQAVVRGAKPSCCGSAATGMGGTDPITRNLYAAEQTTGLPEEALLASFGCGNPTALAELRPGETVLDLGSGGGIDVLLSARRVGPTGKAYGLDMTDEMIALAENNKLKAGASNVEFLKGTIEEIPLPDGAVDVIIFELRDQPVGRQGQGSARSVSRAQAGRPLRGVRHRPAPRVARVGAQVPDSMDRVCRRGFGGKRIRRQASQ